MFYPGKKKTRHLLGHLCCLPYSGIYSQVENWGSGYQLSIKNISECFFSETIPCIDFSLTSWCNQCIPSFSNLNMYVCVCVCVCTCTYAYILGSFYFRDWVSTFRNKIRDVILNWITDRNHCSVAGHSCLFYDDTPDAGHSTMWLELLSLLLLATECHYCHSHLCQKPWAHTQQICVIMSWVTTQHVSCD